MTLSCLSRIPRKTSRIDNWVTTTAITNTGLSVTIPDDGRLRIVQVMQVWSYSTPAAIEIRDGSNVLAAAYRGSTNYAYLMVSFVAWKVGTFSIWASAQTANVNNPIRVDVIEL